MIAELAYADAESLNGYVVSVGLRNTFTENVEGKLKVNYTDGSDLDGEFSVDVGLVFNVNENIGIVGEIQFADNVTNYLLGLRGNF